MSLDQTSSTVTWSGFNTRTVSLAGVAAGASIIVVNAMENFATGTYTPGCSGVNDGSVYTAGGVITGGASGGRIAAEVWYLHNVSAGTHNIVLTSNQANSNNFGHIKAFSWTSLQNAVPDLVQSSTANSATLTTGASSAPTQSGELLVAVLAVSTNLASPSWTTPPSGYTALFSDFTTSNVPSEADYQHITATTAQTASWGTNTAGAEFFAGVLVGFKDVVAGGAPTITSVGSGTITQGSSVTITGTNFGTNTGSAAVTLIDGGNSALTANCSATAWGSTSITVTVNSGNVRNGACTVRVTTSGGLQVSAGATLVPPTGTAYSTLGTLRALTFDGNNAPSRLYDSPDIGAGEQVEMTTSAGTSTVTVYQDGNLDSPSTITQLAFRHHNGVQWSSVSHWDMHGLGPKSVLAIPLQAAVNGTAPVLDVTGYFQEADPSELPFTYTVSAGALPTGQTLNASTGKTSGTLSGTGTFSGIVIRATNASGLYAEAPAFAWTVSASPNVSFSGPVPDAALQANAISNPIDIAGYFTNATTFALKTGSWPPGMSLVGSVVTGTPTGAGIAPGQSQAYPVVVTGSNSVPSTFDTNTFTLTVSVPAVIPAAPVLIPIVKSSTLQLVETGTSMVPPRQITPYIVQDDVVKLRESCPMGANDPTGTAYRFFKIPSSALVDTLDLTNDPNPSGSVYKCGVLLPTTQSFGSGGPPIAGADAIFFNGVSFDAGRSFPVSLLQPAIVNQLPDAAARKLRVWQLLGYSTDPQQVYDLAITVIAPGQNGGSIFLSMQYERGANNWYAP